MLATDILLRSAEKLSYYERHLALAFAARIIAGEAYEPAIGPNATRVDMLANMIAARIERSASVGAVLS